MNKKQKIDTRKTSRKSNPNDQQCGLSKGLPNPVHFNKTTVEKYEFPWLVALFRLYDRNYKFECTASLLDHKHVITVASCLQDHQYFIEKDNLDVESEKILLVFGISSIDQWAKQKDTVLRDVSEVRIHPQYQYERARGDLAVLTLSKPVEYSKTIKPICLWDGSPVIHDISVAGWSKEVVNAEKMSMSVLHWMFCTWPNGTFCSASDDSVSKRLYGYPRRELCTVYNKGAPFMTEVHGRWYLRGMVSQTEKMDAFKRCKGLSNEVFADLSIYNGWILSTLNSDSK